jgi:hypothetical protein
LGWKGAALAALGEMAAGFLPLVTSLADSEDSEDSDEGVKLGESTFRAFFRLLLLYWSVSMHHTRSARPKRTSPCFDSH